MIDLIVNNYQDIIFNTARIFSSVFEIILAYILVHNFYTSRAFLKKYDYIPFVVLGGIMIFLLENGILEKEKFFVECIVLVLFLFLFYDGLVKKKLTGSLVFCSLVFLSEVAAGYLRNILIELFGFDLDADTMFTRILNLTLANLIMVIAAIILSIFAKYSSVAKSGFRMWVILLFVPAITLVTFSVYQYYIEAYPRENLILTYMLISCVGLIFINIIVFVLFTRLSSQLNIKREKDILTSQLYLQQASVKRLETSYNRTRSFRHDIKNHILLMNMLAQQEKYDELKDYLREMSGVIDESAYVRISGISAVDAILNEKMYEAQSKSITTSFDVENLDKNNIQPLDLCVILSNALDNAIEANEKIENKNERYIKLKIHGNEAFSVVSVSNPALQAPKKNTLGGYITTKKERSVNHGFGLKTIESTVKKYRGEMLCKHEDGVFTLVLRLFGEPNVR